MQHSSGSAERPADAAADSNAERPAHDSADAQSTIAPLSSGHDDHEVTETMHLLSDESSDRNEESSSEDESYRDVELRHWFGNGERIYRKPLWKDLIPASDDRSWPAVSEVASLREVAVFRSLPGRLQSQLLRAAIRRSWPAFLSSMPASEMCPTVQAVMTVLDSDDSDGSDGEPNASVAPNDEVDASTAHKKKLKSASSAVQPASLLLSSIPSEVLLVTAQYVGAHNLETIWECSACSPQWYGWYCHKCHLRGKYLSWSNTTHFGYCGFPITDDDEGITSVFENFCGCCRSRRDGSGCESCDDLWYLKVTCHTMRDLLARYSGT